ncbi:MAG: hypothetical protein K6E59_04350 [Bacilli bacterium]|nr:hypothetical protein [Bacilli bacterium]
MKKITALLVAAVYLFAVVLISVLGVVSEVRNQTVEVTQIILTCARNLPQGGLLTYPENQPLSSSITALYSRPDGTTPPPEGAEYVTWSIGGIRFDYVLQVRSFNPIYDDPKWKDGQGNLDLSAFALPENATKQELTYSLFDAEGNKAIGTSVNEQGIVHFDTKLTADYTSFLLTISATDNSGMTCNVRLIVAGYQE